MIKVNPANGNEFKLKIIRGGVYYEVLLVYGSPNMLRSGRRAISQTQYAVSWSLRLRRTS